MNEIPSTFSQQNGSQSVANRDKLLMLVATSLRMGVALIGFIVMARFLGPENFGVIATAAAYGGFISIITDFGLTVSTLRNASAQPECVSEILADAIATKLVLTLAAAVIGLPVAMTILPTGQVSIYAIMFLGVIAYAIADLSMVAMRVHRRFDIEATVVLSTSLIMLISVIGTVIATRSLWATTLAFTLSRFVYLATTHMALKRWLHIVISWRRPLNSINVTVKRSVAYAIDTILTNLSSQIDILIFAALLTAHDVGIYQAGARLVQVIMPFAMVLSTVYMPSLASAAIGSQQAVFRQHARRVNFEFFALAIVAASGFIFLGPFVTHAIYGDGYQALISLWPGFAIFTLLRLMAAGYGIQLTALGFIRTRIVAQLLSMMTLCCSVWLLHSDFQIGVTSSLLGLSSLPVIVVCGGALIRNGNAEISLFATLLGSLILSLLMVLI